MGESAFEILYKMYSVERKEHPVAMSDLAKDIAMQMILSLWHIIY